MKNPSFGALHSPLPSQLEMQERKPEEEIQQPAFSHGYTKISYNMPQSRGEAVARLSEGQILHAMRNFAHYAKFRTPCETTRDNQRILHTMRNLPVHRLR